MRVVSLSLLLVLAFSIPASAQLEDKVADRLWESSKILEELTRAPDNAVSLELIKRAQCIAVIPSLTKVAFGIGGQYGHGAASCRKEGSGWTSPSMISLGGGSFGLQIGGQSMDLVMLFMTPDSLKYLLRDKVSLGGDIAAAAGPKGRAASAETSASLSAEILTYSRTRGLFAGISLKGAVLKPDTDANKSLYKRSVDPKELLQGGGLATPNPAKKLIEALGRIG